MPKLNDRMAQAVDEAESSNRELVPEGIYDVALRSVEVREGKESQQPYWLWTFEVPEDADEYGGKRFWLNTSLQPNALWKLQEVFEAFGVDSDTDTDELVGEQVKLVVSQRPIGAGPRMGEITNQVEQVLSIDDDSGGDDGSWEPEPEPEPEPAPRASKKAAAKKTAASSGGRRGSSRQPVGAGARRGGNTDEPPF